MKHIALLLATTLSLASVGGSAQAAEFSSTEEIILKATAQIPEEDRAFLDTHLASPFDPDSSSWSARYKHCALTIELKPTIEALAECARANLGAVSEMSNPAKPIPEIRFMRAQSSLTMIKAALELAGARSDVPKELRMTLANDAACLRHLIALANEGGSTSTGYLRCRAPYGPLNE